jgi:hypothetical protein
MADNTTLPGTGNVIRDLDRTGIKTQVVSLDLNPAGSESLMAGAMPVTVPADPFGVNADAASSSGSISAKLRSIASTGIPITGDALTALQLLDDTVFADDAAFTIGTSKVNAVGGVAVAHNTAPDAADALDVGAFIMNRHRIQWVIGGHPNIVNASARITGANTDAALLPGTISAGTKIVITRIHVAISNACTVNVGVKVGFGTSTLPADNAT